MPKRCVFRRRKSPKSPRDSISLADNVARNFLNREILQNTEKQLMKDSNILADNVANNSLKWEILQNTEEQLMKSQASVRTMRQRIF